MQLEDDVAPDPFFTLKEATLVNLYVKLKI